jgi:hypothetical protein
MMLGLSASSCPLLTSGSWAWKVKAVEARPSSPASNLMVGTQIPKSRPAMVLATKPVKVPVTGSETAPKPALGAVQTRVLPEPVQAPAAPDEAVEVEAVEAAEIVESATAVSTAAEEAAEVAYHVLD